MAAFRWFLLGAVSITFLFALSVWAYVHHANGFSTRQTPGAMERWAARAARDAAIPGTVTALQNPVAKTEEALSEARAHFSAAVHSRVARSEVRNVLHPFPALAI